MDNREEDAARMYPYDSLAESDDDYDEALDELHASRKDGKPHIPTFAQNMLGRLRNVGLLHRTDTESPVNVRKAKMDKEQEVWIRFDTRRDEDQGYMAVEVVDVPRSDRAILAAMVTWLAQDIDFKRLLEAQRFILSEAYAAERKRIDDSVSILGEPELDTWEDLVWAGKILTKHRAMMKALEPLQYVLPLIHYYKPDFDNRSPEEQQELIEKTCGYVNDFLESLRKLQAFLEYGTPDQKKLAPAIKEPKRDVQAAVLRDVDGLTYAQIGKRMGIYIPPNVRRNTGDHQTVRKMVGRGKQILEGAFGEEGWREHVEKMKAEKAQWQSLTQEQQDKIIEEEALALDRAYYQGNPTN